MKDETSTSCTTWQRLQENENGLLTLTGPIESEVYSLIK